MKLRYVFFGAAFLSLVSLCFPGLTTRATLLDPGNGISVGSMVTVSKNNSTWDNYLNTSNITPTGQTLVVKPGDTLYFKGEVWNSADAVTGAAVQPLMVALIKNAKYLDNIETFAGGNADKDGNGIDFVTVPGPPPPLLNEYNAYGLTFSEPLLPKGPLGPGNIPESGLITAKVKADVPDGTVIEGTLALFNLNQEQFQAGNIFTKKALADGFSDIIDQVPERASVRILVTQPAVTTLPATGASISVNNTATEIGVIAIIGALTGLGAVKIRKVVKEKAKK